MDKSKIWNAIRKGASVGSFLGTLFVALGVTEVNPENPVIWLLLAYIVLWGWAQSYPRTSGGKRKNPAHTRRAERKKLYLYDIKTDPGFQGAREVKAGI